MLQFTNRIKVSQPTALIHYLSYDYSDINEVTKSEYTQIKRDLKLDSIIDDVKFDEDKLPAFREDDTPTMGIKMYQKNVSLFLYSATNPEQHKYVTWIQELERIALGVKQNSMLTLNRSLDLPANNNSTMESVESFARKVVSKMVTCGSYIAMTGRIGPGNVAYIGTNALEYLLPSNYFMSSVTMETTASDRKYLGNVAGFDCVICREINPDSIIIFRSPGKNEQTLALVEADFDDNRWCVTDMSNNGCYAISFNIV